MNAGDSRNNPKPRALEGIRVLDFSHALAGPYCTLLLGDYGAEVYKLEPRSGDMGRGWGPPFAGGESHFFLGLNRGKRGISIDLKQPEGIELCLRLIDRMDVLIENFRPGAMDRLGLGYEAVHQRNPRLIYCSISGYGQNGPSRDEAAMDLVVQSSSGLLSITGTEEGESVRCGYGVTDVTAGLFSVIGILLALRARESTGTGQYVDVSMLDSMISTMSSNYMSYLGSGNVPKPMGTAFPTVVPYRVFQTEDRAIAIAVGSEKLWSAFCRAIERPELERSPRLRDQRGAHPQPRNAGAAAGRACSAHVPWRSGSTACRRPAFRLRWCVISEEVAEHPQSAVQAHVPRDGPSHGRPPPRHRYAGEAVRNSGSAGRTRAAAGTAHARRS